MGIGQIAIVLYPGMTALDAVGLYEVLRFVPGARIRFAGHEPGPVLVRLVGEIVGAERARAVQCAARPWHRQGCFPGGSRVLARLSAHSPGVAIAPTSRGIVGTYLH